MYYVDSPEKTVIAFDYDLTTGKLSNERVIIRLDTSARHYTRVTSCRVIMFLF